MASVSLGPGGQLSCGSSFLAVPQARGTGLGDWALHRECPWQWGQGQGRQPGRPAATLHRPWSALCTPGSRPGPLPRRGSCSMSPSRHGSPRGAGRHGGEPGVPPTLFLSSVLAACRQAGCQMQEPGDRSGGKWLAPLPWGRGEGERRLAWRPLAQHLRGALAPSAASVPGWGQADHWPCPRGLPAWPGPGHRHTSVSSLSHRGCTGPLSLGRGSKFRDRRGGPCDLPCSSWWGTVAGPHPGHSWLELGWELDSDEGFVFLAGRRRGTSGVG